MDQIQFVPKTPLFVHNTCLVILAYSIALVDGIFTIKHVFLGMLVVRVLRVKIQVVVVAQLQGTVGNLVVPQFVQKIMIIVINIPTVSLVLQIQRVVGMLI